MTDSNADKLVSAGKWDAGRRGVAENFKDRYVSSLEKRTVQKKSTTTNLMPISCEAGVSEVCYYE